MKKSTKTMMKLLLFGGIIASVFSSCEKKGPETGQEIPPVTCQNTSMERLHFPLSDAIIYSKGVGLNRNAIIQSFDIAKDGSIYYNQTAGSTLHQMNVIHGQPGEENPGEMMVLEYFGHGSNMSVEETGDGTYIWMGSYGNKGSDGVYGGSQAISRIKYVPGTTVQCDAGETFYLPGARNIHPAINQEKDLLGVEYSEKKSGFYTRNFIVYRLSAAMKLAPEQMKLAEAITYGGEDARPEVNGIPEITARDLSRLEPLFHIRLSDGFGDNGALVGKYAFQGFDIDEEYIWYYEGWANDNDPKKNSHAIVSIVDKNLNLVSRKEVKAFSDNDLLLKYGMADRGYFEAEGIKAKGDKLYLGGATRRVMEVTWPNGKKEQVDRRLANVLVYQNN